MDTYVTRVDVQLSKFFCPCVCYLPVCDESLLLPTTRQRQCCPSCCSGDQPTGEREGERHRERGRERDTEREGEKQRERDRGRETEREREGQRQREGGRERNRERETEGEREGERGKKMGRAGFFSLPFRDWQNVDESPELEGGQTMGRGDEGEEG